ncbi:EAL and HDOD domain-containing protein [Geobacter sp. DSM 9736]|uniref:EAL and HDOD domain-containing protein n=1 Tax=Geobacter sp. DSM 9736 TaxID=1277350 RepID=UPI000B50835F|nr:HDOD domain-containing protein [Geobacter sp. DSM 9736]SNB47604.1 EAL and modified HD-GYP domain-containing signal transduction protein [Geobacter sp. DSM 9736]
MKAHDFSNNLFLGRQPILDAELNLVAYELLFRSSDSLSADVTDEVQACAHVIVHTLSDFGLSDALGKKKGYINLTQQILMADVLDLLPKEQVVIELLESIRPTPIVVSRCRELKRKGFTLALDDHVYDPEFEPLYELVDIIKVDLLKSPSNQIIGMLEKWREWPLTLLAEKVETHEQLSFCRNVGFQMFQGYFFAKPTVIQQRTLDTATLTLMRLMDQVLADADSSEIEETFKQHPELIYNLLRLVNSVYLGMRGKIKTVRHALAILGRDHLKRWLMLCLYALNSNKGIFASPLMELAAVRGKFMENIVRAIPAWGRDKDSADRAFMTGVLSLIDVLLNVRMEEVVGQCNIADEMRDALLHRTGVLGQLLIVSEHLEQSRTEELDKLLEELSLSRAECSNAQLDAVKWANRTLLK